jgi:hypothetical protein
MSPVTGQANIGRSYAKTNTSDLSPWGELRANAGRASTAGYLSRENRQGVLTRAGYVDETHRQG